MNRETSFYFEIAEFIFEMKFYLRTVNFLLLDIGVSSSLKLYPCNLENVSDHLQR